MVGINLLFFYFSFAAKFIIIFYDLSVREYEPPAVNNKMKCFHKYKVLVITPFKYSKLKETFAHIKWFF